MTKTHFASTRLRCSSSRGLSSKASLSAHWWQGGHGGVCTASPKAPPPVPPDPMAPTHRRPREVDTSRHCCPHSDCASRGWLRLGNLRANGHPSGGLWRQLSCRSCNGYFLETHGTLF